MVASVVSEGEGVAGLGIWFLRMDKGIVVRHDVFFPVNLC